MTPELIKQWAKESGFAKPTYKIGGDGSMSPGLIFDESKLSEFAALVAAHQRELDAQICEVHPDETGWNIAKGCAAAIRGTK